MSGNCGCVERLLRTRWATHGGAAELGTLLLLPLDACLVSAQQKSEVYSLRRQTVWVWTGSRWNLSYREGSKTDIDHHTQQLLALSLLGVGTCWKSDPYFPGKSPEDLLSLGRLSSPREET